MHYCVGTYPVKKYQQSLLTIEELSNIIHIDGGQITLELIQRESFIVWVS